MKFRFNKFYGFIIVFVALFTPTFAQAGKCECTATCTFGNTGNQSYSQEFSGTIIGNLPYLYPPNPGMEESCQQQCRAMVAAIDMSAEAQKRGYCGVAKCNADARILGTKRPFKGKSVRVLSFARTETVSSSACTKDNQGSAVDSHASCCPPGNENDIKSVFQLTQANLKSPIQLTFTPWQNPNYELAFQQYLNYAAVGSSIVALDVGYTLWDITASPDIYLAPGGVFYKKGGTLGVGSGLYGPFFTVPNQYVPNGQPMQTGRTYKIVREVKFKDANGKIVSFYDPNCKNREITVNLTVLPLRSSNPGGPTTKTVGIFKIEGQPDVVVDVVVGTAQPTTREDEGAARANRTVNDRAQQDRDEKGTDEAQSRVYESDAERRTDNETRAPSRVEGEERVD